MKADQAAIISNLFNPTLKAYKHGVSVLHGEPVEFSAFTTD